MKNHMVLELKDVSKSFKENNGRTLKVVDRVNLHLEKGECIGIVGESGCGKSTLARLISHLIDVSEGQILYKGKDITTLSGRALKAYYTNIQMIFQDPLTTFSPRMKIGAYLMEPFINFKIMERQQAYGYGEKLLEMVGLNKEYAKKYPNELSGGQLQRVVIARAMGLKPDIIICDECTSALDVSIQQQVLNLFAELREKNNFSSIFITHDLAVAENLCDRIYVMYFGKVVEVLKSKNIIKVARHPYTKMLLRSVFSLKNFDQEIKINAIKADSMTVMRGCAFSPHCAEIRGVCLEKKAELKTIDEGCKVACHLYND